MISVVSYHLLSIIFCGEVNVHTLWLGLWDETDSKVAAKHLLLNSLIELQDKRLVHMWYHKSYGDTNPIKMQDGSILELIEKWYLLWDISGPLSLEPDAGDISIEISEKGSLELDNLDYAELYEKYLSTWYK